MNRDHFHPNHRVATQTAFQDAVIKFGDFLHEERFELGPREWDALLSVIAARIAGEYRVILERDELRRRRSA
jgi:uncharacterized protein with von Willebrand factor type A (vWA) domain